MKLTAALARFTATATPSNQLAEVVVPAVADCFGCILAGAKSEIASRLFEAVGCIGRGNAPLFGNVHTVSPSVAALINAAAGHAYDLDDWEEPGNTHPTVVMLPALLAAATVSRVSGRAVFDAYCTGFEVICRLGEAVSLDHYARGFHSTATLGAVGAAASVSRLLRLGEGQILNALAFATSQACGYTIQFGSNAKPLQAGTAARAGLEAALLAAAGATAQPRVIEDRRGFFGLMGNAAPDRSDAVAIRIGSPWAVEEYGLMIKPWPSCGYTHRLMTAALELRDNVHPRLDEITGIEAVQPDFHNAILPFNKPSNRNEALFSAPACIGQILVAGNLELNDGSTRFWEEERVARLIDLTTVKAEPARNPALNYDPQQPDQLTVWFGEGSSISARCQYPLGAPANPVSEEILAGKYQSNTGRNASDFYSLLSWIDTPDVAGFFAEAAR